MVRHNLAAIRYRNFDFFLGAIPTTRPLMAATRQLAETFRNVHVAECANAGPTSKADCLNWVYRRMLRFEEEHGVRFDTVVLHDAEDMIHPEALCLIDRDARPAYAMVQVPVLPLPTASTRSPMACIAMSLPNSRPSTCTRGSSAVLSFLPKRRGHRFRSRNPRTVGGGAAVTCSMPTA